MNIFDFFLLPQFIQIVNSFGKINLPSKIEFKGKDDLRLLINTSMNKNNDIVFSFNFYKKNKIVDIADVTNPTMLFFLAQFKLYVQEFLPLKDPKIPRYKKLFKYSKISFTLMKRIIRESDMHRRILFLYLTKSLNVYSVIGFNNVSFSRTIIRSMNRINIISSEFINNENLQILINLNNLNITLFNYIIQNNLSLFFNGLTVFIAIVRICLLMVWIITDLGIFSISHSSQIESKVMFNSAIIVNLAFLAIWLLLPKIVISIIKIKIKINKSK